MADNLFKIPKALEYKGDSKNWQKFKQQFDVYMKASGLDKNDSENKVNVFLNIAGEEALEIFANLNLTTEGRKDYDLVIQAFDSHCMSKENEIYKRFKFFTRTQQPSEFFIEFYDDLLHMSSYCNFGNQKDYLLRDRIIAGIRNSELQEKFLKSPDLTLEEVVNICLDQETEKIDSGLLKSENVEIFGLQNSDEESNNNYDELTNVPFNELEQIHIPNEILYNDMAAEEGYDEEMEFEEIHSEFEMEDAKPINIARKFESNKRNLSGSTEELIESDELILESSEDSFGESDEEPLENSISSRKTRSSCKPAKKNDQQTVPNRKTRSKLKIDLRKESIGESDESFLKYYEVPIEDQEEYSEIHFEETGTSPLMENKRIEVEISSDVSEIENRQNESEIENTEENVEEVSLGVMNEMAEAEYLLEKDTNVSPQPKKRRITKRGKNRKSTQANKKEPEIVRVNRDNLPTMIVKAVKKKMLLLGKMPYPCKKCDATFWTSFQLERHQLVHVLKKLPPPSKPPSKVFKCEECGKEFKKICDLERHTRVHTGEKPSVCNICNKRFQQSYNLNKHLYTHTHEKNFECVICQKKFGRNDVLNRHVLTHSIVKPFRCSVCSRTFIRNSQLKLHLRKHHGLDEDPGNGTSLEDPIASTSAKE